MGEDALAADVGVEAASSTAVPTNSPSRMNGQLPAHQRIAIPHLSSTASLQMGVPLTGSPRSVSSVSTSGSTPNLPSTMFAGSSGTLTSRQRPGEVAETVAPYGGSFSSGAVVRGHLG